MLIRVRLMLLFTLLVLLIQVLFAGFVYSLFASARTERFAAQLQAEAGLAARLLVREHHLSPAYLRTFLPRDVPGVAGEQLSVFDPDGHLLYTSADAQSLALHRKNRPHIQPGQSVRFEDDGGEKVGIAYRDPAGHYYTVFADGVDEAGGQQLYRLRLILLVATLGALVLSALAGHYFAGRALAPLRAAVQQVRRITAERLNLRLHEGNGTDELAQLAATFNQMLDRLEESFTTQRSFVAHASHELRTPLTTLLGTLETAADYDRTLPDAQASIKVATRELRKLIELVNGLLALAQAGDSTFMSETVQLDECLLQALAYCRARYPAQPVHFTLGPIPDEAREGYTVRGNAQLLTTAILNVLDNALKFSGQPVAVTLEYATPSMLQLRVTDQGPGLSVEEQQRAFEPLYRGPSGQHRPGHGIGLAVTRKVIELHRGQAVLLAQPDGGAVATLTVPAAVD
jgi:signal transduction histidine kinase